MKLIAISGKARHGKDSAAERILNWCNNNNKKAMIVKYGDFLKFILKQFYGWDGRKDEVGRELLQQIGTNVFRANDVNCWVNMLRAMVSGLGNSIDYMIISDCRFPNEIDWMKEYGMDYISLRINRTNFVTDLTPEQQKHPSETSLDNYNFDYVINNANGIKEFYSLIDEFIEKNLNIKEIK